ncbi:unnamed protein product [Periconia digitata]|uniref:Uncharacterized protein n=1 Tax=Periconia digitata TaxID=1303443 RepID=A0A9W4UB33_9PLEO|nr:unnamed protein product [Periconia digitata]
MLSWYTDSGPNSSMQLRIEASQGPQPLIRRSLAPHVDAALESMASPMQSKPFKSGTSLGANVRRTVGVSHAHSTLEDWIYSASWERRCSSDGTQMQPPDSSAPYFSPMLISQMYEAN